MQLTASQQTSIVKLSSELLSVMWILCYLCCFFVMSVTFDLVKTAAMPESENQLMPCTLPTPVTVCSREPS